MMRMNQTHIVTPQTYFSRQSIAFFIHPDNSAIARPVIGGRPARPEYGSGITAEQHTLNRFASTYKY